MTTDWQKAKVVTTRARLDSDSWARNHRHPSATSCRTVVGGDGRAGAPRGSARANRAPEPAKEMASPRKGSDGAHANNNRRWQPAELLACGLGGEQIAIGARHVVGVDQRWDRRLGRRQKTPVIQPAPTTNAAR